MSFHAEATRIRNNIRRYTTHSFVSGLLDVLHRMKARRSINNGIPQMPWIPCLAFEWAFELVPYKTAVDANSDDVHAILQQIWELQNYAYDFNTIAPDLALRRLVISQNRFQVAPEERTRFLYRFVDMLNMRQRSKVPKQSFEKNYGIDLETFFYISVYLLIRFSYESVTAVRYETLVHDFGLHISIPRLTTALHLIGATPGEIAGLIRQKRQPDRELRCSEYSEEPVLVEKPLILLEDCITTPHPRILDIGISEFVMRALKRIHPGQFKDKFTTLFEEYIANLFVEYHVSHHREAEINSWYKSAGVQEKVADFFITSTDGNSKEYLLIDAKAVEPKSAFLSAATGRMLREQLRDGHIKGIQQIALCANALATIGKITADIHNRHALIVTHGDFQLTGCDKLLQLTDGEGANDLRQLIDGKLLSENIHFCTVADLEAVLNINAETGTTILDFLKFCKQQQSRPETAKFDTSMNVHDFSQALGLKSYKTCSTSIQQQSMALLDTLANRHLQSREAWGASYPNNIAAFISKLTELKAGLNY